MKRTIFTPNEFVDCGDYYEIILYRGNKILVETARTKIDKDDYAKTRQYKWNMNDQGYAVNRKHRLRLHNLVLNKTNHKLDTDHINGDRLDNRKKNLRICTHSQNLMNQRVPSDNTSGYTGIIWDKERSMWMVRIKKIHLGRFKELSKAIKARKQAELRYFGEFAHKVNN